MIIRKLSAIVWCEIAIDICDECNWSELWKRSIQQTQPEAQNILGDMPFTVEIN